MTVQVGVFGVVCVNPSYRVPHLDFQIAGIEPPAKEAMVLHVDEVIRRLAFEPKAQS